MGGAMIAVLFGGTPAALEAMEWTAGDQDLEDTLNLEAAAFQHLEYETADPDPDLTHAKAMAAKWGGKIMSATKPPDLGDRTY